MAKQTVTAIYDSREYANNAMLQLRQAGTTDVTLSPEDATASYATGADRPATGFWASLENMFGDTDDHGTYAEGVRRGGILLTAHVDDTKLDDAVRILEQHGSVDLDERETTWRSEGWSGTETALGVGGVGAAGGLAANDRDATALASTGTATRTTATATDSTLRTGSAPVTPTVAATGTAARTATGEDTLQVVEEQLNVGKRAINRGKVRIHSYVVETPVSESVSLRDETVTVDRRPVDRAVAPGDLAANAFGERTIEAEEVDEEAVVGKTARVVEEIGLRKTAEDRVQTINDSVRSTKVDIEDSRTAGATTTGAVTGFATQAREDMEVVGSDGTHVGVIDHVQGNMLKLKKQDAMAGGQHHLLGTDLIAAVDTKVMLSVTAAEAMRRWTAA